MRLQQYLQEEQPFEVPMAKKRKEKALNPKTNRMKTKRKTMFLKTSIKPEDRTFKNLPRYSDNKPKVRFQDWLLIRSEKLKGSDVNTFGKSEADGKWYGWSHRAVHGFGVGDEITSDTAGNEGKKSYKIKDDKQARNTAKRFARAVS